MTYKHLLFVFFLSFSACSRSDDSVLVELQGIAMTVPYKILLTAAEINNTPPEEIISQVFAHIDTTYNKWNPNSELSRINRTSTTEPIPLSSALYAFLTLTQNYVLITEGRFDPTIERLQQVWKKALNNNKIPSQQELEAVIVSSGWNNVTLKDGCLIKKHPNVEMDLGGIAKGYAVDLIVEKLTEAGYKNIFVEWGGEIRTTGQHPEKRPWRIFISKLGVNDPDQATDFIELENGAVATSGDYLQQWFVEGQTYCHIICPQTKRPLKPHHSSIASVTVQADTCLKADVLATATMLFANISEATEWSHQHDATFWIYSRESLKYDQSKKNLIGK